MFQNTFTPFEFLLFTNFELSVTLLIVAASIFASRLSTIFLLDILFGLISKYSRNIPPVVHYVSWLILTYHTYAQIARIETYIDGITDHHSRKSFSNMMLAEKERIKVSGNNLPKVQDLKATNRSNVKHRRNWLQNIIRILY